MTRRNYQRSGRAESVILACILTLFIFSLSVVLVLNLKWLYYIDITLLGIEKKSGMDVASIRANYDALIQYNQFWFKGELNFPTLLMSETGRIHFAEVKRIFVVIQYLCVGSFLCSVIGILRMRWKHRYGYLRKAGLLTLLLPIVLGVLAALNWERFFVTFHRIFFRNDYWLFDAKTDPIILILPDTYFLHCAIAILLCVLAGSLLCLFFAGKHRRGAGSERRNGRK